MFRETFDRGLDQAKAAVITVEPLVTQEILQAVESAMILTRRDDLQLRPFVDHHIGAEIFDDQTDRLAVVTVGRIADEPGARIGFGLKDPHFSNSSTRLRKRGPNSGSVNANSTKVSK